MTGDLFARDSARRHRVNKNQKFMEKRHRILGFPGGPSKSWLGNRKRSNGLMRNTMGMPQGLLYLKIDACLDLLRSDPRLDKFMRAPASRNDILIQSWGTLRPYSHSQRELPRRV
jgi:hypothetical protein